MVFQEAGLLFDWFVKKRGLAAGIAYSSGGIGGTVFPFLIQALYDRFSYRTSMIALVSLADVIPVLKSIDEHCNGSGYWFHYPCRNLGVLYQGTHSCQEEQRPRGSERRR